MAKTTRSPARTPDERAANLKKQTDKVRKRYKVNVRKRRKFTFEGEEDLVADMIVVLKLANYSNTQVAMVVGISRKQVATFLEDGNVQKKYLRLKEALPQAAFELGRMYLIEAVASVVHVMRTTEDEGMILKAAAELFDRFGIPKSSRVESAPDPGAAGDDNPMSDPGLMDKLRKASPEIQQAVVDLQDSFLEGVEKILSNSVEETADETP
jgi:hypothetical protein